MSPETSNLPLALQKWLAILLWEVIISDQWVAKEEFPALQKAMQLVTKEDLLLWEEKAQQQGVACALEPPEGLDFDQAYSMFLEILQVALADHNLAPSELALLERGAFLLGFGEGAIERALDYAQGLDEIQGPQIQELKNILQADFTSVC